MSKIIIAFFLFVSLVATVVTAFTFVDQYEMTKDEIPVTGQITNVHIPQTRNHWQSYDVVFKTADGTEVPFYEANNVGIFLDYENGDTVPVCYRKEAPEKARIWEKCGEWDRIKLINGMGLVFASLAMAGGAWTYFKQKKQ